MVLNGAAFAGLGKGWGECKSVLRRECVKRRGQVSESQACMGDEGSPVIILSSFFSSSLAKFPLHMNQWPYSLQCLVSSQNISFSVSYQLLIMLKYLVLTSHAQ
jgi:hypothetical protein